MKNKQLNFADLEITHTCKASRVSIKLDKIDALVDWDKVLKLVKVVDRTDRITGGCPHKDLLVKVKMLFLQGLYNLSDPELEDQVNDRLSFQRFVGLHMAESVPDFTTIWRFRDRLSEEGIGDKLFELIKSFLDARGLFIKKGTIIDATIIQSSNRPLSRKRKEELKENPSSQMDTDAGSTAKRGKKYYGYKGHIGTDVESKLIRKRSMSSASIHDINFLDAMLSGDEKAIFADKAYARQDDKRKSRASDVYYGILDKATKKRCLSSSQKKKNKKNSKIRSAVEHPFAYMKVKLGYRQCVAKNLRRNSFHFDINCIIYNLLRADYLLARQ